MKTQIISLTCLLPLASSAVVFTSVDTYAVNQATKVYGIDRFNSGPNSSVSQVTNAQFNWPDNRNVAAFAEAGPNLMKSSILVQGSTVGAVDATGGSTFTGNVQAGGTAATGSDVQWGPSNTGLAPGATLPASFNFSYHGILDVPTVGGDLGWNRGRAQFKFNIFTLGAEAPPIRSLFAQFDLNSSGTGLMYNPMGFDIFDDMGNTVTTIMPSITPPPIGANDYDFTVAGTVPFTAINQTNFRVEFEVNVLAAASDTNLVHRALFENTASYSITSTDPNTSFTLIPEPGSTALLTLSSLFVIGRRRRA